MATLTYNLKKYLKFTVKKAEIKVHYLFKVNEMPYKALSDRIKTIFLCFFSALLRPKVVIDESYWKTIIKVSKFIMLFSALNEG